MAAMLTWSKCFRATQGRGAPSPWLAHVKKHMKTSAGMNLKPVDPVILLIHVCFVFSSTFAQSSYQRGKSLTIFHKEVTWCMPEVSVASEEICLRVLGGGRHRAEVGDWRTNMCGMWECLSLPALGLTAVTHSEFTLSGDWGFCDPGLDCPKLPFSRIAGGLRALYLTSSK